MKSFKEFLLEDEGTVVQQPTEQEKYHKKFHENLQTQFKEEYPIIMKAFERNNIKPTDYENVALGFAIRRGEGGGPTRQFGVLDPRALGKPGEDPNVVLDRQAGWAAATILKNRERYKKSGQQGDFISYLGNIYAPTQGNVQNDPTKLNKNWISNVSNFYKQYIECTGPNCPKPDENKTVTKQETEKPKTEQKKPEQPKKPQPPQDPRSPVIPPLLGGG